MLASTAANAIRYTITGSAGPGSMSGTPGTELVIINEALQAISRRYPWRWLTRTSRPMSLIAGQPYVNFPTDFDELIAVVRGPGLLTWLEPISEREMLELRAGTIPTGDPFGHYYTIEHEIQSNPNLVLDSESFAAPSWVTTNATASSSLNVAPDGAADAAILTGTTTLGVVAQSFQVNVASDTGRTYVASVYVKAGVTTPADATEVSLRQSTSSGVTSATTGPLTTARLTWSGGVPSVALQASQGGGAHDVRVDAQGDGWYRVSLLITVDTDRAIPSSSLFFVIRPSVGVVGGTVLAWGAQLEQSTGHEIDTAQIRATPYRPSTSVITPTLERRMNIWPTPTTTQHNAFLLRYRARPQEVASENDQLLVPWFIETLLLEACRHIARGWHSEDMGTATERLASLWQMPDFAAAIQRDDDSQQELGRMTGLASGVGMVGRNWNQGSVAYPGGLA